MHSPRRRPTRPEYPTGIGRRAILRAALGVTGAGVVGFGALGALTGCDLFEPGAGRTPHALDGFLVDTVALGGRYDAALAAVPALAGTLTPLRDAHRAHATALAAELGTSVPKSAASAVPASTDRAQALIILTELEKSARDAAVTACLATTSRLAPLLASIAAARASHLEVLR